MIISNNYSSLTESQIRTLKNLSKEKCFCGDTLKIPNDREPFHWNFNRYKSVFVSFECIGGMFSTHSMCFLKELSNKIKLIACV